MGASAQQDSTNSKGVPGAIDDGEATIMLRTLRKVKARDIGTKRGKKRENPTNRQRKRMEKRRPFIRSLKENQHIA